MASHYYLLVTSRSKHSHESSDRGPNMDVQPLAHILIDGGLRSRQRGQGGNDA